MRAGTAGPATTGGHTRPWIRMLRQLLAFALETALLFAVAYWAITTFPQHRIAAATVALATGVVLWGLVMAPRARNRLPWPALPLVAAGAFLAGAGALMISGLPAGALLFAVAALANLVWELASGHPAVPSSKRSAGRRSARR